MDELGVLIVGGISGNTVSLEQLLLAPLGEIAPESPAVWSDGLLLEARTVDERGLTKRRIPLATAPICVVVDSESHSLLSGVIPYDSDAIGLRVLSDGGILHEVILPKPNGTIELSADWSGKNEISEARDVTWRSSLDSSNARYLVSYSWDDGQSWMAVSLMLPSRTCPIDFATLPGGRQCRLRILGSDGSSAAVFVSERFAVRRKGVECSILIPSNGAVIAAGPTLAIGQAYDHESRRFIDSGLVWTDETTDGNDSSIIGSGSYAMMDCSLGVHRLKLHDREGGSSAEVVFEAVSAESVVLGPVVAPYPPLDA